MSDKVQYYATAKRATAGRITQIKDGLFVSWWVGKLRGMIVSAPNGNYRHATREEAMRCARDFRDRCRAAVAKTTLPDHPPTDIPTPQPIGEES